jgi:hypothetical protein
MTASYGGQWVILTASKARQLLKEEISDAQTSQGSNDSAAAH